jgi:hypothetical protein
MPRHLRTTTDLVQKIRASWYEVHYSRRQQCKNMAPEQANLYRRALEILPAPTMTVYGSVPNDFPPREHFQIAGQFGLDVELLNQWYWSDFGWNDFQALWKALPEPVKLYPGGCVQLGELSTLYTEEADLGPAEDELIHKNRKLYPSVHMRPVDKFTGK